MQSVPALLYKRKTYSGLIDFIHGGGEIITEIFIPSHKLLINTGGGIYAGEKPNNSETTCGIEDKTIETPLKYIQLPPEFVEKIALIAKMQAEVADKKNEINSELNKMWDLHKKEHIGSVHRMTVASTPPT